MVQINQDNLHLLMPGKLCWLVEYLHDDFGFSLQVEKTRCFRIYNPYKTETMLITLVFEIFSRILQSLSKINCIFAQKS